MENLRFGTGWDLILRLLCRCVNRNMMKTSINPILIYVRLMTVPFGQLSGHTAMTGLFRQIKRV